MTLVLPDFTDFLDVLSGPALGEDWYTYISSDASGRRGREGKQGQGRFRPKADVLERENETIIYADLPGVTKDQVSVHLENNKLNISGELRQPEEYQAEGANVRHRERAFTQFQRTFNVPAGLKPEEIKANMENGVLRVTFPRRPAQAEAKRIQIS